METRIKFERLAALRYRFIILARVVEVCAEHRIDNE
jgi:hypothetical protein